MEEALHTGILIIHVLGATIIIGVAFVTLLMEAKNYGSKEMLSLMEYLWKIATTALGIQFLTGLYLAGSEWDKISPISYFWIKMVLFFVVGGFVGYMNKSRAEKIKAGKPSGGLIWPRIGLLTFVIIAALGVMTAESAA